METYEPLEIEIVPLCETDVIVASRWTETEEL